MKKYCIIVAGGNGRRMLSELPKQFHLLGGKPVLLHSLETFSDAIPGIEIILVLPAAYIETWKEILVRFRVDLPHTLIHGGETRFQSVKNGISCISSPGLVAVHDAVRPLVTRAAIIRIFDEAEKFGSAVPVVAVNDTVRQTDGENSRVIDRNSLRLVQTPEIYPSDLVIKAFESPESASFTDVTSVIENSGYKGVHLCEGEIENIKITRPFDLLLAEAILRQRAMLK